MELKHKSEWPEIIGLANIYHLTYENILLLLALREGIDGPEGQEFKRLDAMSYNLDGQTRAMISFIKEMEEHWQKYIKRLNEDGKYFDFIEYITESDEISEKTKQALVLVKKEFEAMPKENV